MIAESTTGLGSGATTRRVLFLTASLTAMLLLRFIDPTQLSFWFPFALSCGAVTGLPCIFCGLTRALHLALNGQIEAAIYFNWLSLPLLCLAGWLAVVATLEIVAQRRLYGLRPRLRFTRRTMSVAMALLPALWILQVYLAVSGHKAELLNPHGPLYSFFVK